MTHAAPGGAPPVASGKAMPAKSAPTPSSARPTAVLPLAKGSRMHRAKKSGYWIPQTADLKRLERDTPAEVRSYRKQYIGVIYHGRRIISISGFSPSIVAEFERNHKDWRYQEMRIHDGSKNVFYATYDPQTRQFAGPVYHSR